MSVQSKFFQNLGLPYQAENVHQMFSAIDSAGDQEVVVAQVAPGRYYLGYGDAKHTAEVEKAVKTVKKYRVTSVTRIKKG
jgi:hypothetical protein